MDDGTTVETRRRAPRRGGLLIDSEAAAADLGVSRRTLERWRIEGRGPAWVQIGRRCQYTREALEDFIRANTKAPLAEAR